MTTNNNYRTWLTNWQSAATFSDLPSIPGLLAISTNRRDEVIYITKLANLRTAEACTCQFGNVAALLQVLMPDYRLAYWVAPPDEVVSAQLGSLVQGLIRELRPRLNTISNTGTVQSNPEPRPEPSTPKVLPAELVVEEDEILV